MAELSGRCSCGKVTWHAKGSILWAGICHCESCRRATSAPMNAFFGLERQAVTWTGQLSDVFSSGGSVRRQFCPACGTHMTYQSDQWPEETHLYAATLDDASAFIPEAHYHWAERLQWVAIHDGLPKHQASADAEGDPT